MGTDGILRTGTVRPSARNDYPNATTEGRVRFLAGLAGCGKPRYPTGADRATQGRIDPPRGPGFTFLIRNGTGRSPWSEGTARAPVKVPLVL